MVCAADWTALCGGKEFARAKGWIGTAAGDAGLTIAAVFESASPGKMELIRRKTLHQGLLRQAIDCALKRWEALTQLVEDCTLEIDNNLIENAIRPGALGKKNRLFVGHPEAGEAQRGNLHVARQLSAAWSQPIRLSEGFVHAFACHQDHPDQQVQTANWAKAKLKEPAVAQAT